jgi:hypothetical protein
LGDLLGAASLLGPFLAVGTIVLALHSVADMLANEGLSWSVSVSRALRRTLDYRSSAGRGEFWGYAADETLDNESLIDEAYRGIRPAPGYPACPEHSEKATLFRLLDAPGHAGMSLTESFAMLPAAAVSGYYFSHPQSQYFVVGRVSKEQAEDYARRKGVSLAQAERWLASNLDYDPE